MWEDHASKKKPPPPPPTPKLVYTNAVQVIALRKQHRLNQSEFWARVAVTQSGGSRYEAGRNIPKTVRLLLQLAYGTPKESNSVLSALRKT